MSDPARKILIVEDSPAMRQLLALAVKRVPGVVVEQASDGLAALKAMATTSFALVMLDLNMPVMDGMKVLERMQAEGLSKRMQVAVVTTEESAETEAAARKLGAKFFLRKPVNRKSVERMLAEAFGLAELR